MARTKGALNKRTRAALHAAAEGKLGEKAEETIAFLLKIANDPSTDHGLRVQAANAALPYCKPRLAAIEQTNIDARDELDPAELEAKLVAQFVGNPELLERLNAKTVKEAPEQRARLLKALAGASLGDAEIAGNVLPMARPA